MTVKPLLLIFLLTVITSHTHASTLEICGEINDDSRLNAKGNCLKVREITTDNDKKWFTSTPSNKVMESLGYVQQDNASNSGDSYAKLDTEYCDQGACGYFATFRQDGKKMIDESKVTDNDYGVNGQFDRWCQKLATLKFAGKDNWRRPSEDELYQLLIDGYIDKNMDLNLFTRFGWPTRSYYWTADYRISELMHTQVRVFPLDSYSSLTYSADYAAYASCIALEH